MKRVSEIKTDPRLAGMFTIRAETLASIVKSMRESGYDKSHITYCLDIFQTIGSGPKTGRIILPQSRKRKENGGSLKNLFDFFDFAVYKILHVSTVTIVYEH
jgi:hypothetical protein